MTITTPRLHHIAIFMGANQNFPVAQTPLHELWKSYSPPSKSQKPESASDNCMHTYSRYKINIKLKIHTFSIQNAINTTKI